jgi:hypothetical protein
VADLDALLTTLKNAAEALVKLEITTAVGPIKWDPAAKDYVVAEGDCKVMRTSLNILDGHKLTQMDPEFATGPLKPLVDYHRQAESEGHDILLKNIAAAKALFDLALHYKTGR